MDPKIRDLQVPDEMLKHSGTLADTLPGIEAQLL